MSINAAAMGGSPNDTDNGIEKSISESAGSSDEKVVKASVYADGFPKTASEEECRQIFIKVVPEADIVFVKMLVDSDSHFLGSCFVQFKSSAVSDTVIKRKADLILGSSGLPLKTVQPMQQFIEMMTNPSSSSNEEPTKKRKAISTDVPDGEDKLNLMQAKKAKEENLNSSVKAVSQAKGVKNSSDNSEDKIVTLQRQLEFYFSDANLRRDSYMISELSAHDDRLPLEIFLRFRRVSSLTSSIEDLQQAIQRSTLLELSDNKSKVNRIHPFQRKEEEDDKVIDASLYADGFPTESTIEQCRGYFAPVVSESDIVFVKMRRGKDKEFLGSCFIEFTTPEVAAKVLEQTHFFSSTPLTEVIRMQEYVDRKIKEKDTSSASDKSQAKNDTENQKDNGESKPMTNGAGTLFEEDPENPSFEKGCVMEITGLSAEGLNRKNVVDYFKEGGSERSVVAFVEFLDSEPKTVRVRFHHADQAATALEKIRNVTDEDMAKHFNGSAKPSNIMLLDGEKEKEIWIKIKNLWRSQGGKVKAKKNANSKGGIHGHRGNFRSRGGGKWRRGGKKT